VSVEVELCAMFDPRVRREPVGDLARWADEWTPGKSSGTPGVDGWIPDGDHWSDRHARRRGWLVDIH